MAEPAGDLRPGLVSRIEYFNLPTGIDEASSHAAKAYVLVIYDVSNNKRRLGLARLLLGFGERVQGSSFEAMLTKAQLARLLSRIERLIQSEDNVRIYRIRGSGAVSFFGSGRLPTGRDVIFV